MDGGGWEWRGRQRASPARMGGKAKRGREREGESDGAEEKKGEHEQRLCFTNRRRRTGAYSHSPTGSAAGPADGSESGAQRLCVFELHTRSSNNSSSVGCHRFWSLSEHPMTHRTLSLSLMLGAFPGSPLGQSLPCTLSLVPSHDVYAPRNPGKCLHLLLRTPPMTLNIRISLYYPRILQNHQKAQHELLAAKPFPPTHLPASISNSIECPCPFSHLHVDRRRVRNVPLQRITFQLKTNTKYCLSAVGRWHIQRPVFAKSRVVIDHAAQFDSLCCAPQWGRK